jgi:hypothetical protein
MAKKDKKKKDKQKGSDAADAVEAVRSAVERTFQATTEGAATTSKRTRNLVDEVAAAASRIRETIEDLKILEDVKGIRTELEALARRVAALEVRGPAATRSAPAKRRATAKRTTAKRTPAKRTAAKRTPAKRTAAKRTPAKRTPAKRTTAKRTAKAKPRAKPSSSS